MALAVAFLVSTGSPAHGAGLPPTPKFKTPVCVSGMGVSLTGKVNWHFGPVGTIQIDWGDGTVAAVPSFPVWHVYPSAGSDIITLTAANSRGTGTATTTVAPGPSSATCLFKISPQPLAATGNLAPGQSVAATVKVTTPTGTLVTTPEPLWLSATTLLGGATASACCAIGGFSPQPLTSAPAAFQTGAGGTPGTVSVSYTSSSSHLTSGSDVLTVTNVPIGATTGTATTSYTYASSVLPIAPPPAVAADCSVDVSPTLGAWMRNLPGDITVVPPPGACYRVDEGLKLNFPISLTVDGGTFENTSTMPPPSNGTALQRGYPVFNVLGGSDVTFENLSIEGADPSGTYLGKMAFASGIEFQGTTNPTVDQVSMTGVFGDGITLAPLRGGPNHNSGVIKSPVTNALISHVVVNGAGRMGVAFSSVNGASVTDISLANVGLSTFDVEADQSNEGSVNVTIDGCTSTSPVNPANLLRTFFANGGAGAATRTGNITVENCTMTVPQGTAAVQIVRPGTGTSTRGPFLFLNDSFACGQAGTTSLVSCVAVTGGNVTFRNGTLTFPAASPAEAVYGVASSSVVTFDQDVVTGYGSLGTVDATSSVTVTGGTWTPAS